jgi:hypothetical protein
MVSYRRGMTLGEFYDMMSKRDRAETEPCPIPLVPADEPACVHPFNVTGIQWRARRTPKYLMATIDYRCPYCGELVASSIRDLRR